MARTSDLVHVGTLVTTSCWCGIALAIPSSLEQVARRDHKTAIYCPLGHEFVYTGKTEEQRLRDELRQERDRLVAERARADGAEASLRATKGHVTRLRKRAQAGVCPFGCRRHFADLERHVATKHPEGTIDGKA